MAGTSPAMTFLVWMLARIELAIPVEIIPPALVQIVGREGAAVLLQHVGRRLHRLLPWVEPALLRQPVALQEGAAAAGGDDVGPHPGAPTRARHDAIQSPI